MIKNPIQNLIKLNISTQFFLKTQFMFIILIIHSKCKNQSVRWDCNELIFKWVNKAVKSVQSFSQCIC